MNRGPFTDAPKDASESPWWLPPEGLDLDPEWRIDHHLIPHSLDKALIEKEEPGV